jgi:hypothetical protein
VEDGPPLEHVALAEAQKGMGWMNVPSKLSGLAHGFYEGNRSEDEQSGLVVIEPPPT